jgi:hypothetical protein
MQTVKVVAQRGTEPPVEVDFDIAENLSELTEQFGDEIVFSHAKRSVIIALQGYMRSLMDQQREKGADAATIAATIVDQVRGWKPSQKKAPKTTAEKARDLLTRLSPAERAALVKEFRATGRVPQQDVA